MRARQRIREEALDAGLRLIDQTKFVTAVSELARNTLIHGGGGEARYGSLERDGRRGVWAAFSDEGPGIADIDYAMTNGVSTGDGLGLGLGGARRLVHEFDIETAPGQGTTVRVVAWR